MWPINQMINRPTDTKNFAAICVSIETRTLAPFLLACSPAQKETHEQRVHNCPVYLLGVREATASLPFFLAFENLIALRFPSPAPLASLFRPSFSMNTRIVDPLCERKSSLEWMFSHLYPFYFVMKCWDADPWEQNMMNIRNLIQITKLRSIYIF